ncbi:TonB-dependent receptor [Filimonas lacunae]|nr:TonB-dependent receptor [Filimonas lacunae]
MSFLIVCLLPAAAQQQDTTLVSGKKNPGLIIGNLVDTASKAPVTYATVRLQLLSDTLQQKSVVSDRNGAFQLEKVAFGYYRLRVSAVGYQTLTLDSIHLREERYDFNLGDVKLGTTSSPLSEVIVYAEKPLIENTDGKITYNVGESALSNGSSTAEILKNMPLVSNDPNGKILLRGKEPKILIDDKPVELSTEQLQDLLESLPGGSIEKVELMLNPPPEYATEQGGVINIITKKGRIGWVGKTTLAIGSRNEGNLSGNVSYRNKAFSFTGIAGIAGSRMNGTSYSRRENRYTDSSNYLNTDGDYVNKALRPNLRLQVDMEMNKQNLLNAVYQGNLSDADNNSNTQYINLNDKQEVSKASTRNNVSASNNYTHALTFSYTHKGTNPAEKLRIIAGGNISNSTNNRTFYQQYLNADLTPSGNDSMQLQDSRNNNNGYNARIDYSKPVFNAGSSFTTGATFNHSRYHTQLDTRFLNETDSAFVTNEALSNNFIFAQDIFTIRAGVTIALPAEVKLIGGLQAEHTRFNFDFIRGNTRPVDNAYWNYLPNITLRKDFDKTLNASFVYRGSIRRPGMGELNPSVDYGDPYNIRYGNPYLDASLADNFDWNVSWIKGKYYINGSLGYNNVKDVFNSIRTLVEDGKTETTYKNISSRKEYESGIWGGLTISRALRINASVGYNYNVYDEAGKQLYNYRDGGSFISSFNYSYTPTSVLRFEGNARYNSYADPQGRSKSNISLNLGVQQKFFEKRLIVQLNVIDPFSTQKNTTYTYGSNFYQESYRSTVSRNFRVSFTYQLNRMVQKKISDKEMKAAIDRIKGS